MTGEERSYKAGAPGRSNLVLPTGEPTITVGLMDRQIEIAGLLNGDFREEGFGPASGRFSAKGAYGMILLVDEIHGEVARSPRIKLVGSKGATFTLSGVTIGNSFHWERAEDQTFEGNLILRLRANGEMAAINEIPLEVYLRSVISSEMSAAAPMEFLKAHAILSRSWLLAALERKRKARVPRAPGERVVYGEGELTRWYEQEDHDLYDVCADDHCQRYQGIAKPFSVNADEAVRETRGQVITYGGEICDARYSKCCGGLTETFETAWADRRVPYLVSMPDGPTSYTPVRTEAGAAEWIFSEPDAYCNTKDPSVLDAILPGFDRETEGFFRWTTVYGREELAQILREKSGLDFGVLKEIVPLRRGPSGRISRLKIAGSKRSMIVGKELEIRRWLSGTHLYSAAFVVTVDHDARGVAESFVLHGAGWGHGVGLCQIGAAVMATHGFTAESILAHYFRGIEITTIY
jgi:stage II sporulation protein D